MIKKLTCIECPNGCLLEVNIENGKVLSVSGNMCPRGKVYGTNEVTEPRRSVSSTVKLTDGRVVTVKTDKAIKKENINEVMKKINSATVSAPVKIGDIIIAEVENGINIVATKNVE